MKIAMFGHKRIPSREGGVEIVVEELASRMVKTGNEVTCFNRNGKGCVSQKYGKRYNFNGIEVKTVPTIDKKGMAAVTAAFFSSVMAAFGKYDIVHIHAEGPAFFSWIPKLFHKKIVVFERRDNFKTMSSRLSTLLTLFNCLERTPEGVEEQDVFQVNFDYTDMVLEQERKRFKNFLDRI